MVDCVAIQLTRILFTFSAWCRSHSSSTQIRGECVNTHLWGHRVIPITAKIIGGRKDIWCWVSFSQMYLPPSNHQDVLLRRGWRRLRVGTRMCKGSPLKKFLVRLRSITASFLLFKKKIIQNFKGCLFCWQNGFFYPDKTGIWQDKKLLVAVGRPAPHPHSILYIQNFFCGSPHVIVASLGDLITTRLAADKRQYKKI